MKTKDEFYTSTALASRLISYIPTNVKIKSVADFCIGGGELLIAALKRWKELDCYGVDISNNAINNLQAIYPKWHLEVFDFTGDVTEGSFLQNKRFDLILLNPPFTCKGSIVNEIYYKGVAYHASTAMLFLVNALKYINKQGGMYAIIPMGTLYSQKDRKLWNAIYEDYLVTLLQENDISYFKDCSPSIAIISIKPGKTISKLGALDDVVITNSPKVQLIRGKLSMFKVNKMDNGFQLIHTTLMKNNIIIDGNIRTMHSESTVQGPAVLIPRVGNPNSGKICVINEGNTYVLSDCVIGLKTNSINDAKQLMGMIIDDWDNFKKLYKGTGAKYITMERIRHYLLLDKIAKDDEA